MLLAHIMISPDITSFEQSPKTLNAICMNFSTHIFFLFVIDRSVSIVGIIKTFVATPFIRHKNSIGRNVFSDNFLDSFRTSIFYGLGNNFTVTLLHSKDDCFIGRFGLTAKISNHLATNKGLIGFYNTIKGFFQGTGTDSIPNPVKHEPRSSLRHANVFGKLDRRNAFLVSHENVDSHKPFPKWQSTIFKDRADTNGKLFSAFRTLQKFAFIDAVHFFRVATMDANRFPVPTLFNKKFTARFLIGKEGSEVKKVVKLWSILKRIVFHLRTLWLLSTKTIYTINMGLSSD